MMKNFLLLSVIATLTRAQTGTDDMVNVNVLMKMDDNTTASEIGWVLTAEDGSFQTQVLPGAYSPTSEINAQVEVPGGSDYVFTVNDPSGEGLGPTGGYELTMDDSFGNYVLIESYGNYTDSASFYIPASPFEVPGNETEEDDVFAPSPTTSLRPPSASPAPVGVTTNTVPPSSAMGTIINQVLVGSMLVAAVFVL